MKKLQRTRYIIETTYKTKIGTSTIENVGWFSDIHYSEEESGICIDSGLFSDLLNSHKYSNYNLHNYEDRKGNWCIVPYNGKDGWGYEKRINQRDFVWVKIYRECKEIKSSEIRMKQLIRELSVDQFIEFMKDNGLGMDVIK